jgi:hypothetical protein
MAGISKAELARQLRGHIELLQGAGVNELPIKTRAAPRPVAQQSRAAPAATRAPAPSPAFVAAKPAAPRVLKPSVVPSAAGVGL